MGKEDGESTRGPIMSLLMWSIKSWTFMSGENHQNFEFDAVTDSRG